MPRVTRASLLSVLVAACGGKSSPPPAPPTPAPEPAASTDPVVMRAVAYADTVCACKDAACADSADSELSTWAGEHEDEIKAAFSNRLRGLQLEAHIDRAGACAAKLGADDDDDDDDDGGDDDGDPTITIDEALARMNALTDELCACKDMACAEATFKTMASLKEPSAKPSKAEMEQAMKIAERMAGCQKALMAAEPPEPPPPPPDPRLKAPVAADLAVYLKGIKGLKAKGKLTATIATNLGSFHCELYEKQVPATVANFVGLATGQKPWRDPGGEVQEHAPFYDGLRFHRVIPGFMIQGGDPADDGTGGPGYAFDNEIVAELHHDGAGVLSMANAGPGTNGSQFFITAAEATHLDGKHTVFGRCAEVDLVEKITALHGDDDHPTRPVILRSITFARR